jgi:hypothetical protein
LRRIRFLKLGWLLLFVGLLFVGLSLWLLWAWFNPTLSEQTEGTILSISRTSQNTQCCPLTVEFTDTDGNSHSFSSGSGGDRQQVVGDKVSVYYDPADPSEAQTAKDRVTPFVVGGFVLFVLLLPALILLFGAIRQRKRDASLTSGHP